METESLRKWVEPANIRAVFLDAGNTLVFLDLEAVAETIRDFRVPIDSSILEHAEYHARRRADRRYKEGKVRDASMWVFYFGWMLEKAGVPKAKIPEIVERLRLRHRKSNLWSSTRPGIGEALGRLKGSGRLLAVISNSDGTCRESLRKLGLLPLFEAVYDSTEVGIEKPDAGIFQKALNDLDVRPGEALHVGDLESVDVLGARRVGILPVLVDPFPSRTRDFPVLRRVEDLPLFFGIGDQRPTFGEDS